LAVCVGVIVYKRAKTRRRVEVAGRVFEERIRTDGRVALSGAVGKQRERSISGVASAGGVAEECAGTDGRILISCIGKECPRANTCAEVAVGDA
jgi:hypothetical protein